jgi:hypothetical protein
MQKCTVAQNHCRIWVKDMINVRNGLVWHSVNSFRSVMIFILFVRYAGVPVDFEEVQMDPKSESNEDFEYVITSIRRNGVAIKGNWICVTIRLMCVLISRYPPCSSSSVFLRPTRMQ